MLKTLQRMMGWGFVLLAAIASGAAQGKDARFVTGDSFPPFSDRELDQGGIITDVVRKSFQRAGYETIDVTWRSWLRGFEMTVEGQVDGTFPYSYTRTRGKTVLFSDPITNLTAYGWYSTKRETYDDNLDLVGKTLCLPLGYAELGNTGRMFATAQAKRASPPDMKTCFKLLDAGRVDSVVSPIPEALDSISAAGLSVDDFSHIEEGLSDVALHFVVGKSHAQAEQIIADFNSGLALLRESGELAEILGGANY